MKRLIDNHVKTIRFGDTYYTYCRLWDSPENDGFTESHRVGKGKSQDESVAEFMKFEEKRQSILEEVIKELINFEKENSNENE